MKNTHFRNIKQVLATKKARTATLFLILMLLTVLCAVHLVFFAQKLDGIQRNIDISECVSYGYVQTGNHFTNEIGDAQIHLPGLNQYVASVSVYFSVPIKQSMNITLYYAEADHGYGEGYTISENLVENSDHVALLVSEEITTCRIDIGYIAGEEFDLDCIVINDEQVLHELVLSECFKVLIFLFLAALVLYWIFLKASPRETLVEICITPGDGTRGGFNPTGRWRTGPGQVVQMMIIVATFALGLSLAFNMPTGLAPDEAMRDDIPLWIFQNGALPVGNEPDLVNPIWGFSYAFAPYLTSLLAIPLMWMCSLFVKSDGSLLLAMRLVSVLASTGSVALCFPIGRRVFQRRETVYLFAVLVGFLPQFIFLSSYFNNDAFSLFTVFLIMYFLLRGRENHWDTKSCVGLGVAISLCVLTYYFAYGWVLLSIPFCVVSVLRDKTIQKKGTFLIQRICLVSALVFCLAGWYFIRNAYLYDGDFLALSASGKCAAAYEVATGIQVYHAASLVQEGVGLLEMLFDMGWINTTLCSFVGGFGYMSIFLSKEMYSLYYFMIAVGLLCCLCKFIRRPNHILDFCLLLFGVAITVTCSIYFSYTSGYQPQGRYVISILPALALLTALGYEQATVFLTQHRRTYRFSIVKRDDLPPVTFTAGANVTVFATLFWSALFVWVWMSVMVPQLWVE